MNKRGAIEILCRRAERAADNMAAGQLYRVLASEWKKMAIDARAEFVDLQGENRRLRELCEKAAGYIDMHVQSQAIFRGDGDITVAPPFLPALRVAGLVIAREGKSGEVG